MTLVFLGLVLHQLGFNLELGKLLSQPLRFDAKRLSLLLAHLDLLLHQDPSLNGLVELGLHVLERGGGVSRLAFKIIVGNLGVSQL
jgi:hypothetical protein